MNTKKEIKEHTNIYLQKNIDTVFYLFIYLFIYFYLFIYLLKYKNTSSFTLIILFL